MMGKMFLKKLQGLSAKTSTSIMLDNFIGSFIGKKFKMRLSTGYHIESLAINVYAIDVR